MRTHCSARKDNSKGSNTRDGEPSLPSPMAEMLDLLKVIAQNMTHPVGGGADPHGGFFEFLRTQPPFFTRIEDHSDADDWLHTIEQKLALVWCDDHDKF